VRTRFLVVIMLLKAALAIGLGIPLAVSDARASQGQLFTNRLTDTISFASLAGRPLAERNLGGLTAELTRYDSVYGVPVLVVDRDKKVVAASRQAVPQLRESDWARVDLALVKRRSEPYPLLMPWDAEPMVLAEPVLVDDRVLGAIVTISPTDALRNAELQTWSTVAAIGLAALLLAALAALPVVRWILRPVRRLDEGTGRVAAAVLAGKTAEPVADGTGPSELRHLSESFDRMAETVTQAYSAQRQFVADASHQLRNPLTALRLRLSNLEDHVRPSGAEEQAAAHEEAQRLTTLLDGLLALARAERSLPMKVLDVDAEIEDRVDAWRPLAEHCRLRLARDGVRNLKAIGSEGAIDVVLDAVLDNAIKFSPPSGVIVVSTSATQDAVEIAVRDTGPGLAPEELERATDRFWRSSSQSNIDGSGLGLAIAARTVELSGGSLRLERPSKGGLRVVARLRRAGHEPPTVPVLMRPPPRIELPELQKVSFRR
jgi:signal transduction histidine kinase